MADTHVPGPGAFFLFCSKSLSLWTSWREREFSRVLCGEGSSVTTKNVLGTDMAVTVDEKRVVVVKENRQDRACFVCSSA